MSQVIFEKPGKINTDEALKLAIEAAHEKGIGHIVFSCSEGYSLGRLIEMGVPSDIKFVLVTTAYKKDGCAFPEELRADCEKRGIRVCTAAHALSGTERSFSTVFKGISPVEIVAHTLKMFGQGTKVSVECATMAADAGLIPAGEPVISMGGTGSGLDTAMVLKASFSAEILNTKIEEFICKPQI